MKISNIEFPDKPLFLAPMEDVTDPAFRLLCKRFGADMLYTEFVSSEALIRSVNRTQEKLTIYPANMFVTSPDVLQNAIREISRV
jgi:tRNA-dihydrouridine synthase